MADSKVWLVDELAASNLACDLGLSLSNEQIVRLSEHLANHRISTFDLGVSRIQSEIAATVHAEMNSHRNKSGDWSDGCRATEAAIYVMTSRVLDDIRPHPPRTAGGILRKMLVRARDKVAANPQYQVVNSRPTAS